MRAEIKERKVKALAQVLRKAREKRLLSDREYARLHASFIAYDEAGTVWSVGLREGKWNRREGSGWVLDRPAQKLHMEDSIVEQIEALEVKLRRPSHEEKIRKNKIGTSHVESPPQPNDRARAEHQIPVETSHQWILVIMALGGLFVVLPVIILLFGDTTGYVFFVVWLLSLFLYPKMVKGKARK